MSRIFSLRGLVILGCMFLALCLLPGPEMRDAIADAWGTDASRSVVERGVLMLFILLGLVSLARRLWRRWVASGRLAIGIGLGGGTREERSEARTGLQTLVFVGMSLSTLLFFLGAITGSFLWSVFIVTAIAWTLEVLVESIPTLGGVLVIGLIATMLFVVSLFSGMH